MKKILLLLVAFIHVCIFSENAVSETENKPYNYLDNPQYQAYLSMFELNDRPAKIVFVGDSIVARCNFDEFFPDEVVLNRGIGSDVTEGVYNRIDEIVSHHPQYIFIMIGINDIGKGIPVEDSMWFYQKAIESIRKVLPDCRLYILSVLPTTTCLPEVIQNYNEHLKFLSNEMEVPYVSLYDEFIEKDQVDASLLSADGVHLNGTGYTVMIRTLKRCISD